MKRYFITGTDTNCGKTYVTTQLLRHFSQSKAIKPVASGCFELDNQLINDDALKIQACCGLNLETINPWRFKWPVSPHIAAQKSGTQLSSCEISAYCMEIQIPSTNRLFIEGAGGLMVPLNEQETWIDFLDHSQIPVILVVGMTLGCLNHALLTQSVLNMHPISCVGWIANCIDEKMNSLEENLNTLIDKMSAPLLAVAHHKGGFEDINLNLI